MSIHAQGWDEAMEAAIDTLPAGALVKSVHNTGILMEARRINPDVRTLYRHWLPVEQQRFGNSQAEAEQLARSFFERFANGSFRDHAASIDYVEEYNEYLPWFLSGADVAIRLRWMEAVARVWQQEYRIRPEFAHIRLVLANQSVGNDLPPQAAEIALRYDCLLSYHAYTHYDHGTRDPGDWRWHSGRWHFMEEAWRTRPDWIFTEAGPYFDAQYGWQAGACLGGDLDAYVAAVRAWLANVKQTAAYREGRCHGYALFTTGPDSVGWPYYQTRGNALLAQAQLAAAEWQPVEDDGEHLGADVSYWQGPVDWQKMKAAGVEFAIIRATIGGGGLDERWTANRDGVLAAGILPGCYHLYKDDSQPDVQASRFAEFTPAGFVPVVDVEDINARAGVGDRLFRFLQAYEALTGVKPVIYTGAWWWNPHIGPVAWAHEYPLWVANYTDAREPLLPSAWEWWTIWQYTSSAAGYLYGAGSAKIDLDRFRGNLQAWWAQHVRGGAVEPPPPPPEPTRYRVTASVLNLRQGPGTGYRDTGDLLRDEVVAATGERNGEWVEVLHRGWAHGGYLEPVE